MARVNITVPDHLLEQARAAGLNVSRVAASALNEELDRRARISALDAYLDEMDAELGPVPESERRDAVAWADALEVSERTVKRTSTKARSPRSA
ncbi:MAG: type II toxin-antitoxin system CcdA family antitoxin [Dermatophilaceae bacterium]